MSEKDTSTETEITGVWRIENHTARVIILPALDEFPMGVRLVPGLNTVPKKYLHQLQEYTIETAPRGGAKRGVVRYPGRDTLAQLQEPVTIVTSRGTFEGPQITIYEDAMIGRPDGIIPESLDTYKKEAALKFIEITSDRAALKRWAKSSRDPEVKMTANAKLMAMGT